MAQYVDVTNLPNFEVTCSNGEKYILLPYEHLSDIPTADVAPRAEVAREIIDEFMSAMRVKHEENRPKYGGALALLLPDIEQIAAELKKKYTEGKTDGKM
jgi:hypothetical protein